MSEIDLVALESYIRRQAVSRRFRFGGSAKVIDDGDDVVSTLYITISRRLQRSYDRGRPLVNWLASTLKHEFAKYRSLEQRRRRVGAEVEFLDGIAGESFQADGLQCLLAKERVETLRRSVSLLPQKNREAVVAKFSLRTDAPAIPELAARWGVRPTTIYKWASDGIELLRERIGLEMKND